MLGYDSSWASFPVIEVMSQPRFAYKRIGYLAASQTFTKDTDVTLLCTQLFSREFTGTSNPCVVARVGCLGARCNGDACVAPHAWPPSACMLPDATRWSQVRDGTGHQLPEQHLQRGPGAITAEGRDRDADQVREPVSLSCARLDGQHN